MMQGRIYLSKQILSLKYNNIIVPSRDILKQKSLFLNLGKNEHSEISCYY
jgi:hypothetical protein